MQLPFFFSELPGDGVTELVLDETASRHAISVLRLGKGDGLMLTDGRGRLATAIVSADNKKKCMVTLTAIETLAAAPRRKAIGVSLLKNTVRLEWFLEKATELGITEIFPLICERTSREKFRMDRMQHIVVSALLQSRQARMPVLHAPTPFPDLINGHAYPQLFIAHCMAGEKPALQQALQSHPGHPLVLIGPEGDFTAAETGLAVGKGFLPVSLGHTRLRTETAAMATAVLLTLGS
jgi:16S rRNA (uracil1498-N3)-methyltransferase